MKKRIWWIIAKKDLRAITSNKRIWLSMIILPLLMTVAVPFFVISELKSAPISDDDSILKTIQSAASHLPRSLAETIAQMPTVNHLMVYIIANYMLVSTFLMIPVLIASLTALNSFVGEKERKTLETLLMAPIGMKSLFFGKLLASFIPTMGVVLISFLVYGTVVNSLAYGMFDKLIFPAPHWWMLIFWLIPILSILVILLNILISARVKTFQEAQQLGGLLVLPIVALVAGQGAILLFASPLALFGVGVGLLALAYWLLRVIAKRNDRHVLFEKQIH